MKISQLPTEKASDILCQIIPEIENFTNDEKLKDLFAKFTDFSKKKRDNKEIINFFLKELSKEIPYFIKKYSNFVYKLISLFNEKTIEEVKKQNFLITISELKDLFNDKELIDFFS